MTTTVRGPRTSGVGRVLAFNWPYYVAGLATALAGMVVPAPEPLRSAVRVGVGLALAWMVTSLAATWWAYDHRPLFQWHWLSGLVPDPLHRYAVISAGLDEISSALAVQHPTAGAVLVDLYHPRLTRTGSIRRARALVPPPVDSRPGRPEALPVPSGSLDAVFVAFAAHELRRADQRGALFAEVARILRPGGSLVLVEHCRDLPNIAVYGPGAWHFFPRREWLRLGRSAGLWPAGEATMTPLVHALAYRR